MKKLFISQPMRGKTDEEIMSERADAINVAAMILKDDIEVIDSVLDVSGGMHPLYYLGDALKLLSTADIAYFSEGWSEARGCRIEHLCAEEYEIPIIEKNN